MDEKKNKNYGTEQFDTQAQAYLKSAAAENEKIIGYLAFPGQNGQLVYSGSQPGDGAAISGTNYLNASMPSNTVLSCADASLASLTDQTNFSQNAEFTLYLSDVTYHFRAVAVYNTDAAGTENAFTPASYGELSDYYSYAEFSQSIKERSLFDTGNAFICLGVSYSVAAMIQRGEKFSLVKILRDLLKSVPDVTDAQEKTEHTEHQHGHVDLLIGKAENDGRRKGDPQDDF